MFWEVQWVQGACENAIGAQNQDIQSDNGGEYISKAFKQFLKDHGIKKKILTVYRLKHNGVAKCANRIIVEMATSMLHAQNLHKSFWIEMVANTIYTRNQYPTRTSDSITSDEA